MSRHDNDNSQPGLGTFCPLCGAPPGETCRNITNGKPMYRAGEPVTHPARHEAVWHSPAVAARSEQIRDARREGQPWPSG